MTARVYLQGIPASAGMTAQCIVVGARHALPLQNTMTALVGLWLLRLRSAQVRSVSVLFRAVSGAELHNSQFTIDISHLANGIYFLKIKTTKGECVRKIIKQ